MSILSRIESCIGVIVSIAAGIGVLSILALMMLTVVTVIFRFIGIAFPGTYVLSELLLVPAISFSLAYASWKGAHTKVDLLTRLLPKTAKAYLESVMLLMGTGFWVIVCLAGIEEVLRRSAQNEATPLLDIPVAPFRWLMVSAIVLMIIILVFRAIQSLVRAKPGIEDQHESR